MKNQLNSLFWLSIPIASSLASSCSITYMGERYQTISEKTLSIEINDTLSGCNYFEHTFKKSNESIVGNFRIRSVGGKETIAQFENGTLSGHYRVFYHNFLTDDELYLEGIKNGRCTHFSRLYTSTKTPSIHEISVNFRDAVPNGEAWIKINGKMISSWQYTNGVKNGMEYYFDEISGDTIDSVRYQYNDQAILADSLSYTNETHKFNFLGELVISENRQRIQSSNFFQFLVGANADCSKNEMLFVQIGMSKFCVFFTGDQLLNVIDL